MALVTLPTPTLPLTAEASFDLVNKLVDAIKFLFSPLANAINTIYQWLSDAFNALAKNIYGAFQWIYNGISYFVGQFVSLIGQVIKAILGVIQWVYNSIKGFFDSIINSINGFITSLATRFRNKLIDIIRFDLMFMLTDRLIKKVIDSDASLSRKIGMGIGGVFANLFISEMVARVIDALLPPAPSSIPVFPQVSLPSIDFTTTGNQLMDAIQRQASQTPSPPVGLGAGKNIIIFDYISMFDSVGIPTGLLIKAFDSISLSDAVNVIGKAVTSLQDFMQISDSVSIVKQVVPYVDIKPSDILSISDIVDIKLGRKPIITVADSPFMTDTVAITVGMNSYLQDDVYVLDELQALLNPPNAPIDSVEVEDFITLANVIASDDVTVEDFITTPSVGTTVTDDVTLEDSLGVNYPAKLSDSISITDSVSIQLNPP
jgi:hypothetical protein